AALRTRQLWGGVAAALLIALPWHLASYLQDGPAFLNQYLNATVIARIGEPVQGHPGNALTYIAYLRNQFFPWAYGIPFARIPFRWWWPQSASSASWSPAPAGSREPLAPRRRP